MFEITSIQRIGQPDVSGEIRYIIHVRAIGDTNQFSGWASPGPHGPQIDWSDDFQDLLMAHKADFPTMNLLLFQVHNNEPVAFPVTVGSAA